MNFDELRKKKLEGTSNPPPKVLRPVSERVQLMLQEDLNNWENNFCLSLMTWITSPRFTSLSEKQENKLREMEKDRGLSRYQGEGPELPKKGQSVIKPAPYVRPPASTKQQYHDMEDLDDDIPF